jgi:hypothetical protein
MIALALVLAGGSACSSSDSGSGGAGTGAVTAVSLPSGAATVTGTGTATAVTPSATSAPTPTTPTPSRTTPAPAPRLRAGNPAGRAAVPAQARPVDTSRPTRVIGKGTAASCTSAAVVAAVARGGVIRFSCGPKPITIVLTQTAKVHNTAAARVVLDGAGLVTLSGGGQRRILYQNTCDQALGWLTSHCQNQDRPQLILQNLTFADGNSTGDETEGGGGGAVFVRGGRLTVINSVFVRNRCDATGPDLGGAALRVLSQYDGQPVHVVSSTFGGAPGQGGRCSNGGALSSIGVSWVVLNSLFTDNSAIGRGANPTRSGSPGGGSGGAIYADGNRFTIRIAGTVIERNHANEGGGAIFFVSNDHTGTLSLESSRLRRNPSAGFETAGLPGIFFQGASRPRVVGSSLTR